MSCWASILVSMSYTVVTLSAEGILGALCQGVGTGVRRRNHPFTSDLRKTGWWSESCIKSQYTIVGCASVYSEQLHVDNQSSILLVKAVCSASLRAFRIWRHSAFASLRLDSYVLWLGSDRPGSTLSSIGWMLASVARLLHVCSGV